MSQLQGSGRRPVSARLPAFPWDELAQYKLRAAAHQDGLVDLSIGTPVDSVPDVVRTALREADDAPGYPAVHGTPQLREAAVDWMRRSLDVDGVDPAAVLPTIGSKELVVGLPAQLGLGAGDVVVVPELAYPSYDAGARIAGAEIVASDGLTALGPRPVGLVWVNSPGNPHGRVLPAEHLAKMVAWCRERGVVLASDECYAGLGWDEQPVSVLHPSVCGGSHDGILAVHSLSKRSNLAGYRAGFVTGDPALVAELLEVRKHAGFMPPTPVQAAMAAALADDVHVEHQRTLYGARRQRLRAAFTGAGFRVDHSEAGMYLWLTRDEDCWQTVDWLAGQGILAAPGDFYGTAGARHVRVALTATDERVDAACMRLAAA
ncbi:MAG: succinyldiaminopimelate transaminase [Streptosporangiales bacterium]|nr:succinyldiaminopimelate transaminase [Streptosporangiales bacterium]